MRIAVISNYDDHPGKTALSLLLTNAYPNATGKESVYVTNSELDEALSYMQFNVEHTSVEQSVNIITALASTENITNNEITDYAYRPKNTSGMLFDAYPRGFNKEEAKNLFLSVLEKFGTRFTIVDLCGDPTDSRVSACIDMCDVILYVVTPDRKQIQNALLYIRSLDDDKKRKIRIVCNKFDETGASKKTIISATADTNPDSTEKEKKKSMLRVNDLIWFPYNVGIQRTMFEGRLCVMNRLMIEGRDSCVPIRQPIYDILSSIYDTKTHKVIREVSKWVV